MSDWTELVLVIRDDEVNAMPPEQELAKLRQELENWRWEQIAPLTFKQDVYKDNLQIVLDNIDELPQKYRVEFYVYHSKKLAVLT